MSPYGKAKLKSFYLTRNFRKKFNLKTYNAILFNCDSILRPKNFVMPKICLSAIRAFRGYKEKVKFGDLNVVRDWGWVEEYVECIYKITQKKPDDIIIATGKYFKLKDLIQYAYAFFDLNWKDYIIQTNKFKRPQEMKEVKVIQVNTISEKGKRLGRPANPESQRQKNLILKEELREQGLLKKGRPVNPNSKKQMREKERIEFLKNGGVIKKGRPKMKKEEI